jgi:hypothetical protein
VGIASAWLELSEPADLEFDVMTSTEASADYLRVTVDGVEGAAFSGETAWTTASFALDPGVHHVSWRFEKDASDSGGVGLDSVFIDNIHVIGPPTLPLAVTDEYTLTGYFSELGGGDQWSALYESSTPGACPTRAGDALGDCLAVTYDRDPDGDGTGPAWSGYYWLGPGGWGAGTGFAMPPGATRVSFWAWGESGGEVFEFKAGCGGCQDAFELSTGDVILDTTPTEYIIDLSGQPAYGDVVGAFAWATDSAPIGASQTFYVDDLAWE